MSRSKGPAGTYSDMTGKKRVVRQIPPGEDGKPAFTMHNFDARWGSHWSLDILWPLLCPERYSDFCKTSVQMYKNGGLIPRGPSGGNYTYVMIGDSAAPAITSAYAKGIRDFGCEAALEGLVRNTEADGGRYYGGYANQGQMGSISALMAIGIFQFDGGSGIAPRYDITAPVFDKITIQLSPKKYGGNTFTIVAKDQAPENVYIQSAIWNGKPLDTCWLSHKI